MSVEFQIMKIRISFSLLVLSTQYSALAEEN